MIKMIKDPQFDVIIIGGGCTGAGMVRDCALRGLKTLLIERGDICSETTGTPGYSHDPYGSRERRRYQRSGGADTRS